MNNNLNNIINHTNSRDKKYKILTFQTHERYETQLCKTGHDFYSLTVDNLKKWNYNQLAPPSNYHILELNHLPAYLNFDFILAQTRFGQFQIAQKLNQALKLPIILLEHTTPQHLDPRTKAFFSSMVADLNIFITQYSMEESKVFERTRVIRHGIDTNVFKDNNLEKHNDVLTVANDFKNRDVPLNYQGWCRITKDFQTRLVGDNKDLSQMASSVEELVEEYNRTKVYLNTTAFSPLPMSLLEAMSCGCAIVTTATCEIPNIIENGVNGFMSNDEEELKDYIKQLLGDENLRKKLGANARQTILDKFSEEMFIDNWNATFKEVVEKI